VARWRARALPVEARGTPEGRMRDHGCSVQAGSWVGLGRIFAANYSVGASVGWSVEEIS